MSLTQSVKLRDLYCFSKSSKVCCRQLASRAMFAGQILRDPGVDKKLSHTSKGVSLGRPRLATNPTRLDYEFEFKLSALVFPLPPLAPTSFILDHQQSFQRRATPDRPASPVLSRNLATPITLLLGCLHFGSACTALFFQHSRLGDASQVATIPNPSEIKADGACTTILLPENFCRSHVLFGESVVQDRASGSSLVVSQPREKTLQISHPTIRYSE